jgi:hypothetical protein
MGVADVFMPPCIIAPAGVSAWLSAARRGVCPSAARRGARHAIHVCIYTCANEAIVYAIHVPPCISPYRLNVGLYIPNVTSGAVC